MSKFEHDDRSNVASVLCTAAGNLGLLEYTIDNLTMDRGQRDQDCLHNLIVTIGKVPGRRPRLLTAWTSPPIRGCGG